MDNLSKFLETHKKIASIFSKEWFESELQKSPETMHLFAKQFTFDDNPYDNATSYHLFDHLEEYLENLEYEIQKKGSLFRKLRDSQDYRDTIGQIETCSFLKKLGFEVELEPKLPNSIKISDIKISKEGYIVYIEVRTLNERPGKILSDTDSTTISTISFHPIINIKNKIKEKSQQISEAYPGIVVMYLDESIGRILHIEYAFSEIVKESPIISGLLLYRHFYNHNGCNIHRDLFCNPFATKPIPEFIIELFDAGGISVTTWQKDDFDTVDKLEE